MKYLTLISKSKEDKEKDALQDIAEQSKLQSNADIQAMISERRKLIRTVAAMEEAVPFNLNNYLEAKRTLANVTEDLEDSQRVVTELFGED